MLNERERNIYNVLKLFVDRDGGDFYHWREKINGLNLVRKYVEGKGYVYGSDEADLEKMDWIDNPIDLCFRRDAKDEVMMPGAIMVSQEIWNADVAFDDIMNFLSNEFVGIDVLEQQQQLFLQHLNEVVCGGECGLEGAGVSCFTYASKKMQACTPHGVNDMLIGKRRKFSSCLPVDTTIHPEKYIIANLFNGSEDEGDTEEKSVVPIIEYDSIKAQFDTYESLSDKVVSPFEHWESPSKAAAYSYWKSLPKKAEYFAMQTVLSNFILSNRAELISGETTFSAMCSQYKGPITKAITDVNPDFVLIEEDEDDYFLYLIDKTLDFMAESLGIDFKFSAATMWDGGYITKDIFDSLVTYMASDKFSKLPLQAVDDFTESQVSQVLHDEDEEKGVQVKSSAINLRGSLFGHLGHLGHLVFDDYVQRNLHLEKRHHIMESLLQLVEKSDRTGKYSIRQDIKALSGDGFDPMRFCAFSFNNSEDVVNRLISKMTVGVVGCGGDWSTMWDCGFVTDQIFINLVSDFAGSDLKLSEESFISREKIKYLLLGFLDFSEKGEIYSIKSTHLSPIERCLELLGVDTHSVDKVARDIVQEITKEWKRGCFSTAFFSMSESPVNFNEHVFEALVDKIAMKLSLVSSFDDETLVVDHRVKKKLERDDDVTLGSLFG